MRVRVIARWSYGFGGDVDYDRRRRIKKRLPSVAIGGYWTEWEVRPQTGIRELSLDLEYPVPELKATRSADGWRDLRYDDAPH